MSGALRIPGVSRYERFPFARLQGHFVEVSEERASGKGLVIRPLRLKSTWVIHLESLVE